MERLGHATVLLLQLASVRRSGVRGGQRVVIPVQVNGKVRARLTVSAGIREEDLRALAQADPQVAKSCRARPSRKSSWSTADWSASSTD